MRAPPSEPRRAPAAIAIRAFARVPPRVPARYEEWPLNRAAAIRTGLADRAALLRYGTGSMLSDTNRIVIRANAERAVAGGCFPQRRHHEVSR